MQWAEEDTISNHITGIRIQRPSLMLNNRAEKKRSVSEVIAALTGIKREEKKPISIECTTGSIEDNKVNVRSAYSQEAKYYIIGTGHNAAMTKLL